MTQYCSMTDGQTDKQHIRVLGAVHSVAR